jgi:tetratricopeptide (TPR) repeat protein
MQAIEEQVYTIERALGERMVKHALFVVRLWLNELGEDNPFEDAYRSLFARYDDFFADWVVAGDGEQDEVLETMTSDAYRLVDAVYAELRIKRGMSPKMHGFNGENPQSVMHYFSSCVQFKDYDMDWLRSVLNDTNRSSIALMTVAALAKNLRECFSETAMMALVDGIHASNSLVAEQCLANVLLLLAHYDVRIDFFRELQEAFVEAIGDGELAFETLCALIKSVKVNLSEMIASGEFSMDNLPEELQNLLGESGIQDNYQETEVLMPASEKEYMAGLVQMLPDTWVYITLVGESEERKRKMRLLYLSVGNMNMMWDKTEAAEQMLVRKLRTKGGDAKDYINYGHCLLLKGDRLMAFENYREARRLCKSAKEFYALFRPDRRQLVDRGIPVEQVYLIEDQLFSI